MFMKEFHHGNLLDRISKWLQCRIVMKVLLLLVPSCTEGWVSSKHYYPGDCSLETSSQHFFPWDRISEKSQNSSYTSFTFAYMSALLRQSLHALVYQRSYQRMPVDRLPIVKNNNKHVTAKCIRKSECGWTPSTLRAADGMHSLIYRY